MFHINEEAFKDEMMERLVNYNPRAMSHYIRHTCPQCHKRQAYTYLSAGYFSVMACSHLNTCGWKTTIKEFFNIQIDTKKEHTEALELKAFESHGLDLALLQASGIINPEGSPYYMKLAVIGTTVYKKELKWDKKARKYRWYHTQGFTAKLGEFYPVLHPHGEILHVMEGDWDWLKAIQDCLTCTSSLFGCKYLPKHEQGWSVFIPYSVIRICYDMDKDGQIWAVKLALAIKERFPEKTVELVKLPFSPEEKGKDYCDYRLSHSTEEFLKIQPLPVELTAKELEIEVLEKPEKKRDIRLDMSLIHPIFRMYIEQCKGKTDAPEEFIASSFLASLAGSIGNKVSLKIGVNPIRCNSWIMLIAESTFMRKTTALTLGTYPLRMLDYEKREKSKEILDAWKEEIERLGQAKNTKKTKALEKPKEELNIYPNDVTAERLVELMMDKPDGLFCFSEIGEFLEKLERSYSQGFKEMLTDMYDCPKQYIRETKISGKFPIKYPAPSMIGASTLSWLQKHLKQEDLLSGFLARFLFCIVRDLREPIPIPDFLELDQSWIEFFRKLETIHVEFEISKEAKEVYCAWFEGHRNAAQEQDIFLHSFLGRLETQVHKFAMINQTADIALGESSSNMLSLSAQNYTYAINHVEYYKANIVSCYDELATPTDLQELRILEIIKNHCREKEGKISRHDLCRHSHTRIKELDEIIDTLVAKRYVECIIKGKYRFYRAQI